MQTDEGRRSGSGLLKRMCTTRRSWMLSLGSKTLSCKDAVSPTRYEVDLISVLTDLGHLQRPKLASSDPSHFSTSEALTRKLMINVKII